MKTISALVCLLAVGLLAGCGDSETKTVTQPAAAPTTTETQPTTTSTEPTTTQPSNTEMQGPAGTMGPPPGGNKYDATDPTVLDHIETALKAYAASKGIPGAQVDCEGVSPAEASCEISNPANGRSVTATVAVNQQTGKLTITKVT